MGTRTNDSRLGPTGNRVAENVKRIRGRVPVRELSDRLKSVGRPILPSGITKIEQGTRRVDTDDLVALAVVLDVTPNRLLFTEGAYTDEHIGLTPGVALSTFAAWAWASGDHAWLHEYAGDEVSKEYLNPDNPTGYVERYHRFARVNRPHDPQDTTDFRELKPHKAELQELARLVAKLEDAGVPRKAAYRYVDDMDLYRTDEGS